MAFISNYPITYDTVSGVNTTRTFNKSDFTANNKSATVADLNNYAHKHKQNLFTETNYFNGIFVASVNDVSDTILTFLSTITENVQTAITYLRTNIVEILRITTNLYYYDEEDLTVFHSNVKMDRLTIEHNLNAKSLAVSDNVNVTHVNTQSILAKQVNANDIKCQTIRCRSIVSSNDVALYIYYNSKTIPVQKSLTLRTILPEATSPFQCTITIKQGYKVEFMDAQNKRLLQLRNDYATSNDFSYNLAVDLTVKPYKINIYYENILL
jgi:hypothetical protein